MSLWRQLTGGLRVLLRRGAADRDLDAELGDYLARAEAEKIAGGLTPEQARRAVRLEAGSAGAAREVVREHGWEAAAGSVVADLRYGLRQVRRRPGFAVVCVATLALGIGAGTAIFSVAYPVLFEALPYPEPGRLLMIQDVGFGGAPLDVTFGTFVELSRRARSFSDAAVANRWQPALSGLAVPERLAGEQVSADFFRTLGVHPAAGRDFGAADDVPGGPGVVVVSAALARHAFGADSAVVGRALDLDGAPYTIVGVMPADFENVLTPGTEVWTPLQYHPDAGFQTREWGHHLRMIARLRPGVSPDAARGEIAGIARTPLAVFPRAPWADLSNGLTVHALRDDVTLDVRPALLAMIGAVLLLLAIACVNVTNLLLARQAQRREEFAMRVALGAGRRRLIRQLLTESMVLASLGGALGLLVAHAAVGALLALAPAALPRAGDIRVDLPVFAFALLATAGVGIVVGLIPALAASRQAPAGGLQGGAGRTTGRRAAASAGLVVGELALAVVLLVGAGLLLRTLRRLLAVDPGFASAHVLTMQVDDAARGPLADSSRERFFAAALEAVRRVPGVESAAFTSQLPLSGDRDGYGVTFSEPPENTTSDGSGNAFRYAVTPDYFRVMGIPLRRGRLLAESDRPGTAEAVVVSEAFARRYFGTREPLGQLVRFGPEIGQAAHPWDVIVGVVGDVKQSSLALGSADAFYVTSGQWAWSDAARSLVVRTTGDAAALAPSVERAIWSADHDQAITRVATMDAIVAASEAQRRFALVVFEVFALAALLLAAAGVYGVLSGRVVERTREIGVRAALGASRRGILAMVLGQGLALTVIGIAAGVVGALAATRALTSLLFGVTRLDPLTYVGVAVLLAAVSVLACWFPARRAASIDPMTALRAE